MQALLLALAKLLARLNLKGCEMASREGKVILTIRTTKDLHRWLTAQAKRNNRSLNQEVEWRLMQGREREEARPLIEELRALLVEVKRKP